MEGNNQSSTERFMNEDIHQSPIYNSEKRWEKTECRTVGTG